MKTIRRCPIRWVLIAVLSLAGSSAFAGNSKMEAGFTELQSAREKIQARSSFEHNPEDGALEILQKAKAALEKGPRIYHGHRAKAVEALDLAISDLKAGANAKAVQDIDHAIAEIHAGGGLTK